MKTQKYNIQGSEINKIQFSEIESFLEEKGLNVNDAFSKLADENEYVYVSNGFVRGLYQENTAGEWHHFFKKVDGFFEAGKFQFA